MFGFAKELSAGVSESAEGQNYVYIILGFNYNYFKPSAGGTGNDTVTGP